MKYILDEKQRVLVTIIRDTANRLYTHHLDQILNMYLTSQEKIQQWEKISKEYRTEKIRDYLADLEPRSLEQIGEQYVTRGDLQFKANVINAVIKYAEERGRLKTGDRKIEIEYRQEVYAYKKVIGRYGIHGLTAAQIRHNAKKGSQAGSSTGGKKSYALQRGVHAFSLDQIVANGSRGGRIAKEQSKGIFAEEYDTTAAARAGAMARGQVIYSEDEQALIMRLTTDPTYHLSGAYNPPRPSWQKIAQALTEHCGIMRKPMSVRKQYEKLIKRKIREYEIGNKR